jgi:hypothetical protein
MIGRAMAGPVDSAPARAHEQRMSALRTANEIRSARARLKRELRAGRVRIEDLLADPPPFILSASALETVLAVRGFGPARAARVLTESRISPSKAIGALSSRQRAELAGRLRE